MKALIFGANGQDGYFLQEKCLARGIEPISISRKGIGVQANVACYEQVKALVEQEKPIYIFHLAANSTTRHDALFENHETISTGTLNILEAVKQCSPQTKVFITGSGLQFENKGQPISETDSFEASSAYCVARIQSAYAARYYRQMGLAVYIGYLFHHESPQRKLHHISQIIVSLAKRVAAGHHERITLGDIHVEKEWAFAGDIVEGILTLVEQDQTFEAVIGTGVTHSIEDWLSLSFQAIDRDWRDFIILSDSFTPEYRLLVSNPKTIKSLGWSPTINFEELNRMMMLSEHPIGV